MRLLHVSYVCGGDGGGGAVLMTEEVMTILPSNQIDRAVDKIAIFTTDL